MGDLPRSAVMLVLVRRTTLPDDDRLRWLSFDHAALRSRFRCPSSAGRHLTCDFRRRLLDLEEVGTDVGGQNLAGEFRSEEHQSELQYLMRLSFARLYFKNIKQREKQP